MAAAPKPKTPRARADRTTLYLLGGLAAAVVLVVVYLRSRGGGLSDTLAGAPSVRAGTPQTGGPVGGASQTGTNAEPSQVGDGTNTQDFSGPHSPFQPGGDNPPPGGGDNTGGFNPPVQSYVPTPAESFPNAGFYTIPHAYDGGALSGPGGPVVDYDVASSATPLPPKVITMTSPLPHPVGPLPGGPVVD